MAAIIRDDLRYAPIHPHIITVSSDELSSEAGAQSSELTTIVVIRFLKMRSSCVYIYTIVFGDDAFLHDFRKQSYPDTLVIQPYYIIWNKEMHQFRKNTSERLALGHPWRRHFLAKNDIHSLVIGGSALSSVQHDEHVRRFGSI